MAAYAKLINDGQDISKLKTFNKLELGDHITQEWQAFIRALDSDISTKDLAALDAQFNFSTAGNDILKSDWFKLCAKANYTASFPAMKAYLKKVGRRWLVEGIYAELAESNDPARLKFARAVFEEAAPGYHAVTNGSIAQHLGLN